MVSSHGQLASASSVLLSHEVDFRAIHRPLIGDGLGELPLSRAEHIAEYFGASYSFIATEPMLHGFGLSSVEAHSELGHLMGRSVIADEINVKANLVAGEEQEYTPDCVVHGIYFGEGDPERGGQHWNFTRNLGEDDDGVCIVKEVQQVTVYGGIIRFTLARHRMTCEFDEKTAKMTGVRNLHIEYSINDHAWQSLVTQAKFVFDGEEYFEVAE